MRNKLYKILAASLVLALAFTFSCSSDDGGGGLSKCGNIEYNTSTQYCFKGTVVKDYGFTSDSRDGKTYKTVKIGEQTWMADNLNYNANNSVCGDSKGNLKSENTAICDKYGRL